MESSAEPTSETSEIKMTPRTYEQIMNDLITQKSTIMTKDEQTIYNKGDREAKAAEAKQEAESQRKWEGALTRLFENILFKSLFYVAYILWYLFPIAGIIIGFIYLSAEECPGRPSIAPLIITLGFMSLLVSFTIGCTKAKKKSQASTEQDQPETAPLQPNEENKETANEKTTRISGSKAAIGLATACGGCCLLCFIVAFKVAHFVVFIVTSFVVYGFYPNALTEKTGHSETEIQESYCNNMLLLFAFWSITVSYIILGVLFLLFCCGCGSFFFVTSSLNRSRSQPSDV